MAVDVLEVILMMKNVPAFVAGAEEAAGAVKGVGAATETAGVKASGGWKGMLKWAAGATAIYGAAKFLKSAVDQTDSLAKSTVALTKVAGMDTVTGSEWVGLTKQRGVSAKMFQTGLVRLSKQMDSARQGTEKDNKAIGEYRKQIDAVAAAGGKDAPKELAKLSSAIQKTQDQGIKARQVMSQLGISTGELAKLGTSDAILKIADSFQKMKDPQERAALAQKLFGRAGVALLPVLTKGAAGVQALLDKQKEAGNYLTDKGLKQVQDNIQQQRDLDDAMEGVKTQLALGLMPVLIDVGKAFIWFAGVIRPLTSNAKAMQVMLGVLTAAFIVWRGAITASAIQTIFATAATEGLTAAQVLLNLAMDANVIGLVVIAIAALVVGFIYAYRHVKFFRDLVNDTWNVLMSGAKWVWGFFKQNWPYLLGIIAGPFGLAAVVIFKHFKQIKGFVLGFIDAIKTAFDDLVRYIEQIPHKLGKALKKIPGAGVATKVAGWGSSALSHLASGGVISRPGAFMVGERGPEVVSLPAGAAVSPLPGGDSGGIVGGGGRDLEITVPVYLNDKVMARAVAKVTADRLARR